MSEKMKKYSRGSKYYIYIVEGHWAHMDKKRMLEILENMKDDKSLTDIQRGRVLETIEMCKKQ